MGTMATILLALSCSALLIYPIVRRMRRNGFFLAALPLAFAFGVLLPLGAPGDPVVEQLQWLPQLGLDLTFRMDQLSWLFALLVTGAGTLVLLYCRNYFDDEEEGLARFAAVFLGFGASMLGLVLADNVYLLFIFWEATSVFSFLLIAHAHKRRTSRSSALQALMVTTAGGLVMLVGVVILATMSGTPNLSEIVASPPQGAIATVSVYLVLVGALSKSAIFPFHFWLPGAMAAPTPVSAYLHAAAMVKAGVYLIARLGEGFAEVPGYRETLVVLGAITMIGGGVRALRQYDVKLIVAHGTVSQLGLLVMVFGVAEPNVAFAGLALLFAHALAKAPLFLVVGIVDHRTGTRDLRRLSGLGRQAPGLAAIAVLASLSMMGVPPLIGFVAKEAAFAELLDAGHTLPIAVLAFAVAMLGSVLTVAYMLRFLWGTFATKKQVQLCTIVHRDSPSTLVTPAIFVALTLLGGVLAPRFDSLLWRAMPGTGAEHLALWHGLTLPLAASAIVLALGTALAIFLIRGNRAVPVASERFTASHVYWLLTHWLDVIAVRLTSLTQRGSLPFYLAVILAVTAATLGGTMIATAAFPMGMPLFTSPVQLPIALIMIGAAFFAMRARTRFQAVVLVGVTGYGMAAIFALHGAPDLALTQALVETVTLIAFVLVIRRLPQRITLRASRWKRWVRAAIGGAVGLTIGALVLISMAARSADPISLQLPELAYLGGHGANVVNVMLVDIRGWDTMGELSVILAAATGVASLVFLRTRVDTLPKLGRRDARLQVQEHIRRVNDPKDPVERRTWLLAGRNLDPSRRSILLEVVVRLIFHALILLSFYLLLVGHNSPGGGFAGGLVAGLALVARYLTGGRDELGATVPVDAGRILGAGLALAATMAILPLFFGQAALSSAWIDLDLGPLGTLPLVTSTLFDIGVYLVVFGLVLDVLRSLGAEIDRQEEDDLETALDETATSRGGAS
ncbi:MAG: Na+/H+ antiporter subunit A [Actinobacteria bacterium]|nr:Na+/H+ antiporter subunit A [Actinomycetota bacterium]